MNFRARSWVGVAAVALLAPSAVMTACGDSPDGAGGDAGTTSPPGDGSSPTKDSSSGGDSTVKPVADTGADTAKPDTGADAQSDAGTDAGTDARADTGADASADTGTDARVVDASPDTSTVDSGTACNAYTVNGFVASRFPAQGSPTVPITIGWNGCPQTAQAVAGNPFATFTISISGSDSYFTVTTAGFHTTLSQYVTGQVVSMLPGAYVAAVKTIPLYDATKGHVLVNLEAVKASCGGTKAGSTVAAPGHPEAVITYLDKNGNALAGSAMDNEGLALLSNLDPNVAADVKPAITVNGGTCVVTTGFFTTRAPVIADTVATFGAQAQ